MRKKINAIMASSTFVWIALLLTACSSSKDMRSGSSAHQIDAKKLSGGSSGMEQLTDSTYLVVYDLKKHKDGVRLGWIKLSGESFEVSPINVSSWGDDGLPNDLESICRVPGTDDEFLTAEAGNWQGEGGRIYHLRIDFRKASAKVLGVVKYPFLHRNDFDIEGDQYEAMHCLPYRKNERIIVLGERGGSDFSRKGVLRWGVWHMKKETLTIEGNGLKGKEVNAPGHWTDPETRRSITDLHVDKNGTIWAAASEDQGDAGPFYSVIYPLGKVQPDDPENPVSVYDFLSIGREVNGLKIEALSGPPKGIECTHTFGTEDEMYGGIFRPINITSNR